MKEHFIGSRRRATSSRPDLAEPKTQLPNKRHQQYSIQQDTEERQTSTFGIFPDSLHLKANGTAKRRRERFHFSHGVLWELFFLAIRKVEGWNKGTR